MDSVPPANVKKLLATGAGRPAEQCQLCANSVFPSAIASGLHGGAERQTENMDSSKSTSRHMILH